METKLKRKRGRPTKSFYIEEERGDVVFIAEDDEVADLTDNTEINLSALRNELVYGTRNFN